MTPFSDDSERTATDSPLRRARMRVGWSQVTAMRRFQEAVRQLGDQAPSGDSLKRMFAYWENGQRAVTLGVYRRAFELIYQAPGEALGFAPPEPTGRLAELREQGFELHDVDSELVDLFESQTQGLRMLDRRLGTAALAAHTELYVAQIAQVLRRSIGGRRNALAAALAGAASLAGWQALDCGAIEKAWDLHDVARTAALESGDEALLAYVTAQTAFVLLDARRAPEALSLAHSARVALGRDAAPIVRAWLACVEAELAAANGDTLRTHRMLDEADFLLERSDPGGDFPYLMLSQAHLARWRGHCLARLGEEEALDYLRIALASAGDSVRATTGLHVDLALALYGTGQLADARDQVDTAVSLAGRFGSMRQQSRLRDLFPAAQG